MNHATRWSGRALICVLAAALFACIKAPEIVMVDRATALEQQAAGSFEDLERKLDRAAVEPRPVPLTPEQLANLGVRPPSVVDGTDVTDADRVDALLVQHCIGEAKDGTLADTREACAGISDAEEIRVVVERVNRARRQLWRWMHEQRPTASPEDLRAAWRERHVGHVVCGGWVESAAGEWKAKGCK